MRAQSIIGVHGIIVVGAREVEARLVELEEQGEIELFRALVRKYHSQGCPRGGGLGKGNRYFVLEVDGYWVAGAWIHLPSTFSNVLMNCELPVDNTYFLRRVCAFAPGDWCVELLEQLCEKLKSEGKECLVALGLPDHSNALYKRAGFELVGYTKRTRHPVFARRLR